MGVVKTKRVEIDGVSYELMRMTPALASYLWQTLMRSILKAQSLFSQQKEAAVSDEPEKESSAEERARGLIALAMMHLSYDDYQMVEKHAMKYVMRVENEVPMPFFTNDGKWDAKVYEDLSSQPLTYTKILTEVLVFNVSGFFG